MATTEVATTKNTKPAKSTVSSLSIGNADDALTLAKELQKFVKNNKLTTNIQGKEFPNVEAWQFAGSLLGLSPMLESIEDRSVTDGEIKWNATVSILNTRTGAVVGRGFATCSNKESTKKYFADYAICSMAQTRAVGKAYRLSLGWLMKAAGYEATPIEEMDSVTSAIVVESPKPVAAPSVQGSPSPAPSENMDVDITDKSQWQDVPGYEGKYYVSRAGRIYSVYNGGQLLTVSLSSYGYPTVGLLGQNSEQRNVLVHRIVAAVFIPNPENKPQVNHINGVKNDNRVDNLEWATSAENIRRAIDNGLNDQSGEGNSQAKLTNALAAEIKTRLANGDAPKVLAAEYGVSVSRISDIKNGHSWVAAAESGDAAPIVYATGTQREEIDRLIQMPCFDASERSKVIKGLPKLTEAQADKVITKLAWAAQEREEGRPGELKAAE